MLSFSRVHLALANITDQTDSMKVNHDSSKLALAQNSTTGPMFIYGPGTALGKPDFPIRVGHEVSLRSALERAAFGAVIREAQGDQFIGEIISFDSCF